MSEFYSALSVLSSADIDELDFNSDEDKTDWRAVLVEGQCQSGKTFRIIELLKQKIKRDSETLILFITQANSGSAADQTLERMQNDLTDIVDIENMSKAFNASATANGNKNQLIVDFWHSRNIEAMKECAADYKHVVIIIDEADQGGMIGVKTRMNFVADIERIVPDCKLFLVTATSANLSKSILKVSQDNVARFKRGSIVHDILFEESVEYQNVKPSDDYVSTLRMLEGGVKYLEFDPRSSFDNLTDYNHHKVDQVLKHINMLPQDKKELTLVAISSMVMHHESIVQPLLYSGYNVVVELNAINNKNYRVSYLANGKIKNWTIPIKELLQLADNDGLSSIVSMDGLLDTGIVKKENIRLPDIIQSALFMSTDRMERIKNNVNKRTFIKLLAMNNAFVNMFHKNNRPKDFPGKPYVALVTGNLASRGITFQDPYIDLLCTSFVFTDLSDSVERGARSTQRFGRACGNLFYKYDQNRKPVVIATKKIVESALANYNAVFENSKNIPNGEMICLRNYIEEKDWKGFQKSAKDTIKLLHSTEVVKNDMAARVKKYMDPKVMTVVARMFRYLYEHTKDGTSISFNDLKDGIAYEKGDDEFTSNIIGGMGTKTCYGKLWIYANKNIKINPELLKLI